MKRLLSALGIGIVATTLCSCLTQAPPPIIEKKPVETTQKHGHEEAEQPQPLTATITGSGDMLYHDTLYWAANTGSGYDFTINFDGIRELISGVDLAIGDFEGTIRPDRPLSGYPLFNAPAETAKAIKEAGFDAVDLAHNHILDMGVAGLLSTKQAFADQGVDTFGVRATKDEPILVREVNGIRIAILGFAYGFNGLEQNLSEAEYATHLADLDPETVRQTIEKAEELADVTVVFPQMGVEYALAPVPEKVELYRQMINWGADIIFGGHPHVIQPTEKIVKDGAEKFIIYSMGNLISDQRLETVDNIWTERGVITEVGLSKLPGEKAVISFVKAHPTWVAKVPNGRYLNGYPLHDYTTYLTADFASGGRFENRFDAATTERIRQADAQVRELLKLPEFGNMQK